MFQRGWHVWRPKIVLIPVVAVQLQSEKNIFNLCEQERLVLSVYIYVNSGNNCPCTWTSLSKDSLEYQGNAKLAVYTEHTYVPWRHKYTKNFLLYFSFSHLQRYFASVSVTRNQSNSSKNAEKCMLSKWICKEFAEAKLTFFSFINKRDSEKFLLHLFLSFKLGEIQTRNTFKIYIYQVAGLNW